MHPDKKVVHDPRWSDSMAVNTAPSLLHLAACKKVGCERGEHRHPRSRVGGHGAFFVDFFIDFFVDFFIDILVAAAATAGLFFKPADFVFAFCSFLSVAATTRSLIRSTKCNDT